MGTNGPTFDKEYYYANKTTKELGTELKKFEDAVKDWPDASVMSIPPTFYNEHIQYLRMKIAERIINKK